MKIEVLSSDRISGQAGLVRIHFDNGESALIRVPGAPTEVKTETESDTFRSPGSTTELLTEDPDGHIWGGGYPSISPSMIPALIKGLEEGTAYPRFAVLMFLPPDSEDGEFVNLQYSWEDGKVGLDWVLLGGRNTADRGLVEGLAMHMGYLVQSLELNDVKYLRVEGPGLADLGRAILLEIYQISPSQEILLLTEGI
jgi:hypothetical protein